MAIPERDLSRLIRQFRKIGTDLRVTADTISEALEPLLAQIADAESHGVYELENSNIKVATTRSGVVVSFGSCKAKLGEDDTRQLLAILKAWEHAHECFKVLGLNPSEDSNES